MPDKKSALASIVAGMASRAKSSGLSNRIPFLSRKSSPSPEPFSEIEDDTPLGDLLSAENAAPVAAKSDSGPERPDIRGIAASAIKRPAVLIGLLIALGFVLSLAIVAMIVSAPPASRKSSAPFTKEGESIVKSWLPPPGDPLEPKIELEREGLPTYGPADAAKVGLPKDPHIIERLSEKNDMALEDLYGTVP
jgi:hypothetical protein